MQISFDTNNLSDMDRQVLSVLLGDKPVKTVDPTPKKAEAEPKPAPKAEVDEDTDVPTKDDAVALATKLVSDGEAARVKAALTECGAKRVSELKDEDLSAFVKALS